MPSTLFIACVSLTLSLVRIQGFTTIRRPHTLSVSLHSSSSNTPGDVNEEVAKLRAAAQKAREEAQMLAKDIERNMPTSIKTRTTTTPTTTTATSSRVSLSSSDILSMLQSTVTSQGDQSIVFDPSSLSQSLDQLTATTSSPLWKSAKSMTQSSFPVSLQTLSTRTNGRVTPNTLGVVSDGSISSTSGTSVSLQDFQDSTIAVTLGSTALAIASLALLPSNIGATLCYFIAFIPIAWIAVGSSAPFVLANIIGSTKSKTDSTNTPSLLMEKKRMYYHEAGHFLCGYLCGLPVIRYSIQPKKETSWLETPQDSNRPQVEFSYSNPVEKTTPLSIGEIATLSVVALSGSVAEIISCGDAKGGAGDLMELDLIFRRKSQEFIGAQKQEELTRWGALTAYQLLMKHSGVYEKLVVALEEGKNVLECIALIEGEDR